MTQTEEWALLRREWIFFLLFCLVSPNSSLFHSWPKVLCEWHFTVFQITLRGQEPKSLVVNRQAPNIQNIPNDRLIFMCFVLFCAVFSWTLQSTQWMLMLAAPSEIRKWDVWRLLVVLLKELRLFLHCRVCSGIGGWIWGAKVSSRAATCSLWVYSPINVTLSWGITHRAITHRVTYFCRLSLLVNGILGKVVYRLEEGVRDW